MKLNLALIFITDHSSLSSHSNLNASLQITILKLATVAVSLQTPIITFTWSLLDHNLIRKTPVGIPTRTTQVWSSIRSKEPTTHRRTRPWGLHGKQKHPWVCKPSPALSVCERVLSYSASGCSFKVRHFSNLLFRATWQRIVKIFQMWSSWPGTSPEAEQWTSDAKQLQQATKWSFSNWSVNCWWRMGGL